MPVRSGVLARWHSVPGTLTSPAFVVPSTDSWILKSVRAFNQNALAALCSPYVGNAGVTEFSYVIYTTLNTMTLVEWQGWLALGPGDVLQFQASRDGMYFWASGADLPGHL
jgi:hypothetical protein